MKVLHFLPLASIAVSFLVPPISAPFQILKLLMLFVPVPIVIHQLDRLHKKNPTLIGAYFGIAIALAFSLIAFHYFLTEPPVAKIGIGPFNISYIWAGETFVSLAFPALVTIILLRKLPKQQNPEN